MSRRVYTLPASIYIVSRQKIKGDLSRLASKSFSPNQYPRKAVAAFQAPAIDRLLGDHDSQVTVTLGTGALKVLADGTSESRRKYQLGSHDFAEFPPSTRLSISVRVV
jgi:hypothetical protein